MLVSLDLCGTLYDAKGAILRVARGFCKTHRLPDMTNEALSLLLSAPTYDEGWMAHGASRETARAITRAWASRYEPHEPCNLIPGARDALDRILRSHDVRFVTNTPGDVPRRRFVADGYTHLASLITQVHDGKGPVLVEIAAGNPIIYVGDTPRDGEATRFVRDRGGDARFVGVTNEYSMAPDPLSNFVERNPGFCSAVSSLSELPEEISRLSKML